MPSTPPDLHTSRSLPTAALYPSPFSLSLYGDPESEASDLIESVRAQGVLVPLVVTPHAEGWEVISGHRRLACARALGLGEVPCEVREFGSPAAKKLAILEYNRQRRKTFSQLMREADALEELQVFEGQRRRFANLRQFQGPPTERPDSDARTGGRTDAVVARAIGLGGKDLYRQARAVWRVAREGDARALSGVAQLDAGTKSIHAAYKDLRRRDRFSAGFRPTPYDVWPFRHDRAFGVPHPGAIPPAIIAHLLHYYTSPGDLVVDPMAGGGTTLDVCTSMGRRCLAYDIHPVRPEINHADVNSGFTQETNGCALIVADPPYHTMLARRYGSDGLATVPLADWLGFLRRFARDALAVLRPGGHVALLLANQTEKDLPAGYGYLDHAFYGYSALIAAGFLPERRISCPMDGAYLPQQVRRARAEGRMLGQVRDLLVMRKPNGGNDLVQGLAASELVDLTPHEGV
ncbi:MAG: DNA methyltransferase [Isosphaeraceae bacterium]|nr:DNA methyltransferase [Isosphaeraceae bacterium]